MDSDSIINIYVDVCNQALNLNKNRFPFKQILGAAKNAEKGKNIEVKISGMPSPNSYIFSIQNNQIKASPHGTCNNCQCDRKWIVTRDYLELVAQNPSEYIENPAKINWEWIYDSK